MLPKSMQVGGVVWVVGVCEVVRAEVRAEATEEAR